MIGLIFDGIIARFTEEDVRAKVDDAILDFLDEDWEDEFEDEFGAYAERGHGEAESQVIEELIHECVEGDLSSADHCRLVAILKDHYELR